MAAARASTQCGRGRSEGKTPRGREHSEQSTAKMDHNEAAGQRGRGHSGKEGHSEDTNTVRAGTRQGQGYRKGAGTTSRDTPGGRRSASRAAKEGPLRRLLARCGSRA